MAIPLQEIPVRDAEVINEVVPQVCRAAVGQPVRIDPDNDGAVIDGQLVPVDVLPDETGQRGLLFRRNELHAVRAGRGDIQVRPGKRLIAGSPGVDLHAPGLVDGGVRQAEAEPADELRVFEVRASPPGQREPGHRGTHSRPVIDERDRADEPLAAARLDGIEHHVNTGGARLDGVVHDLPAGGCGVLVAAAPLRLDRLTCVEQRELVVLRQLSQVLFLPLQFREQSVTNHLDLLS